MKTCCIEGCNCEADPGRKYCHKHFLQRKAEQRKAKKALGQKVRTMYKCVCCNCNKEFEGFRKDSLFCSRECFNSFNHKQKKINMFMILKTIKTVFGNIVILQRKF